MASPWPKYADDARMESYTLHLREKELFEQILYLAQRQQGAQEYEDWHEVARLRKHIHDTAQRGRIRAERGAEIMLAAKRGDYHHLDIAEEANE